MADAGTRDARGEWQPDRLPRPSPLGRWPLEPVEILKFFFGQQGLLRWPNLVYVSLALVSWLFLTPSLERMRLFAFDWILLIYLRNVALLTLVAGGLHLRLYIKRRRARSTSSRTAGLLKTTTSSSSRTRPWTTCSGASPADA